MARLSREGALNKRVIITSIIAGVLLLVVNSAIWVNRQVFNQNNFTRTTVASLTSQSSRDALAGKIVDEALQNYPRIQNITDDSLTKIISGLLDGDRVQTLLSKSVSKLHIYLTSNNQQDVVINLSGIKNTINKLVEILGQDQADGQVLQRVENTPDQIVLIDKKNVPDLYKYGIFFSFIAPFAFLIAIGLLAFPYIKDRANYLTIMLTQGVVIALVGIFSLLIGPIFKPAVLSSVQDPNGRIIVENLYNDFIATFDSQSLWLIVSGILMCVSVFGIPFILKHRHRPQKNE
ncbi:MAG TPA: hypothetical protein VFK11_04670 [Candidatus Saccharimonadales bacterium]|nr:hypothetical protein [Candidatus Saccharimonadales bacterium]